MAVLQLPIPAPSSAENNNGIISANNSPTARKTPSPARSVSSNTNLSTTPLTSNLASGSGSGSAAFFHSHAAATAASTAATNYVGGGGLGSLTLPFVGSNTTTMMHQNHQQQSNTLSHQQRPMSFLQMTSSQQMQMQQQPTYDKQQNTSPQVIADISFEPECGTLNQGPDQSIAEKSCSRYSYYQHQFLPQ